MISGDQVLPRISSNVSVSRPSPMATRLSEWLTSLARIKTIVPDDVLVLPAHNDPFLGLHARLDHLIRGHERGLERLNAHPGRAQALDRHLRRAVRPRDRRRTFWAWPPARPWRISTACLSAAWRGRPDAAGVVWYGRSRSNRTTGADL